jgi:hypothetical protein
MRVDLRLALRRYRFRFEVIDTVYLPAFAGSTWRGMLGHALRDIACVRVCRSISECPQQPICAYRFLFETPPPPTTAKMRLYDRIPHPFVLDANGTGGTHLRGAPVVLHVALIGRANQRVEEVVRALALAADRGAGRSRGRLRLVRVEVELRPGIDKWRPLGDLSGGDIAVVPEVPPVSGPVRIHLVTPLRLREAEHNVTPSAFRPHHLLRNLLRRASLLSYFHSEAPLETDFARLTAEARSVEMSEADLRWLDWQRYSSRQRTYLSMGGLVGSFTLQSADLGPWWPILWTGQWLHAGKGTSMGLGKYRIEDRACVSPADAGGEVASSRQ